jgi:hypothetical protein
MRAKLQKAALTRFALGMGVAAGLPAMAAAISAPPLSMALAFGVGGVAALLGTQQLSRRRHVRVTSRTAFPG